MSTGKFENVKKALKEDTEEHRPTITRYDKDLDSFMRVLENYNVDENEMNEFQLAIIDRRLTRGISSHTSAELVQMLKVKLALLQCRQSLKQD